MQQQRTLLLGMEQLNDPHHDIYETIIVIVYIRRKIRSTISIRRSMCVCIVIVIVVDTVDDGDS